MIQSTDKPCRGPLLAFVCVWFVVVSVPLTFWMSLHSAPLPAPAHPLAPRQPAIGEWQAIHILSAECGCSEAVAEYLAGRRVQAGLHEQVWIVDGSAAWQTELSRAGFAVSSRGAETVAAGTGIEGAPWLILLHEGRALYSGGYSRQAPRPGGSFEDLALWRALRSGQSVASQPAFGCATTRFLKSARDPLGLKARF